MNNQALQIKEVDSNEEKESSSNSGCQEVAVEIGPVKILKKNFNKDEGH